MYKIEKDDRCCVLWDKENYHCVDDKEDIV